MVDFVIIALIGLALLVPLEIILFIVILALKRPTELPPIPIPEIKKQERYGWEDYLKLPVDNKKPSKSSKNSNATFSLRVG